MCWQCRAYRRFKGARSTIKGERSHQTQFF
jgi:hypothetical protein